MNRYNLLPSYKYKEHSERVFEDSVGKPMRNYQFTMSDGSENIFGKIYSKNMFSVKDREFSGSTNAYEEILSDNHFRIIAASKTTYQYRGFGVPFTDLENDTFHFSFNLVASTDDSTKLKPAILIHLAHSSDVSNIVTTKRTITSMGYSEFSYTLTNSDKEKYDMVRVLIYLNQSSDSTINTAGEYLELSDVMFSCIDTSYEPCKKPILFRGEEILNLYDFYTNAGYEKYTLISIEGKNITITKGNDTASNNIYINLGDYQQYAGKTFTLKGYFSNASIDIGTKSAVVYFQKYLTEDRTDTLVNVTTSSITTTEKTAKITIPEDPDAKNLTVRIYLQPLSTAATGALKGDYLTISDLSLKPVDYEKQIIPTHKGYNLITFKGEQPSEFNFEYYKKGR